jgi:hypothetical protein
MPTGSWHILGRQRTFSGPKENHQILGEVMDGLLPGGYNFIHLVFWSVVGMVAVGTNAVAIILVVGLMMLVTEAVRGA